VIITDQTIVTDHPYYQNWLW